MRVTGCRGPSGDSSPRAQLDEAKAIELNHLFFLYKTERLLERR